MPDTFSMKRGDTVPSMRRQLMGGDGVPVDVTGATVRFSMKDYRGVEITLAACVIIDPALGIVQYDWSDGDTDTVGKFCAEFKVTYDNGGVETFPNFEFISVVIHPDIA